MFDDAKETLSVANDAMRLAAKERENKYKIAHISIKFNVNEHDITVSGINPDVVFNTVDKVKKEAKGRL